MADEKIDCISVGFSPVRSEIENLNRKYWDALVTTLQRSILNDIDGIEKFANNAMDTLRRQPQVKYFCEYKLNVSFTDAPTYYY